jgi:hypothetical protein
MSSFYTEGDLAGMPVLFSPSVRKMCCSQVGQDVLRQDAAVLRYAPRVIRTKRVQKSPPFSGRTLDVLAPLQLSDVSRQTVQKYGMMVDDPHSVSFRLAQRAYVVIDQQGIIRYKRIMEDPDHALDAQEIFTTVQKIVAGMQ